MTDSSNTDPQNTDPSTRVPSGRPRVYLEIVEADVGWRYRVLIGITEVESGWRPTWKWARRSGRRAREPYLADGRSDGD